LNFQDYLTVDQVVDFELETGPRNVKVLSRILDVTADMVKFTPVDGDCEGPALFSGMKGILWGKKRGLQFNIYVEVMHVRDMVIEAHHLPSRSHLRVDAFIKLAFRSMSKTEFNEKRKKYLLNAASDSDRYVQRYQRSENDGTETSAPMIAPEILGEIQSIHKKLDFIIKTIGKNEEINIFTSEPVQVNISGSGMRFISGQQVQTGDFLDMEMIIPISSGIMIDLIGEVIRCHAIENAETASGEKRWETAVTFAAISQDDRELIIHYIFKRQRELLRAEEPS
jgi:hypothetical protein